MIALAKIAISAKIAKQDQSRKVTIEIHEQIKNRTDENRDSLQEKAEAMLTDVNEDEALEIKRETSHVKEATSYLKEIRKGEKGT